MPDLLTVPFYLFDAVRCDAFPDMTIVNLDVVADFLSLQVLRWKVRGPLSVMSLLWQCVLYGEERSFVSQRGFGAGRDAAISILISYLLTLRTIHVQ